MFLESATAIGGVLGALTAVTILARRSDILVFTFVPVVLVSAYFVFRARRTDVRADARRDRLAERLRLSGRYFDEPLGRAVDYRATRTGLGLALSGVAGVVSGLLGVGGGIVKVPAMNTVMNIPIRVATATSNFMIGVTAAAGAMVYLVSGEVALDVAAPAILGLLAGTVLGARWHRFASFAQLKVLFATLLVVEAVFLLLRATGVVG
jgi:uncharacterized membrane protein YfcA